MNRSLLPLVLWLAASHALAQRVVPLSERWERVPAEVFVIGGETGGRLIALGAEHGSSFAVEIDNATVRRRPTQLGSIDIAECGQRVWLLAYDDTRRRFA